MTKKKLDLSHTLAPLEDELYEILHELLLLKQEDSPLFSDSIDQFIHKYGKMKVQSLEDLLQSSALQISHTQKDTIPLEALIKDLTS